MAMGHSDFTRDHPRLRGDYGTSARSKCAERGSPPLTRGLLMSPRVWKAATGITPAYAGTTGLVHWHQLLPPDHPRLRGDYSSSLTSCPVLLGSPPLTRGLRKTTSHTYGPCRITPAYAGTTNQLAVVRVVSEDHPRLRGDYSFSRDSSGSQGGSPPLTRGLRFVYGPSDSDLRITPAYAGTTTTQGVRRGSASDHPRLRGDYRYVKFFLSAMAGSPPLTRGLPTIGRRRILAPRITPAYAGTTAPLNPYMSFK